MKARVYGVGWSIIDVLFPPRCGGCGRWGERWCSNCQKLVNQIGEQICPRCGVPREMGKTLLCGQCRNRKVYFDSIRSWGYFEGPLQNAIHELKYRRNIGLGERLAKNLVELFEKEDWEIDCIIPVPLGTDRYRERGYNQVMLLARPMAWNLRIPMRPQILTRVKETKSQVGLTRLQRVQNVQGAFRASRNMSENKRILILDDVTTTGATLNACAHALVVGNAAKVYGLTLARSFQTHDI